MRNREPRRNPEHGARLLEFPVAPSPISRAGVEADLKGSQRNRSRRFPGRAAFNVNARDSTATERLLRSGRIRNLKDSIRWRTRDAPSFRYTPLPTFLWWRSSVLKIERRRIYSIIPCVGWAIQLLESLYENAFFVLELICLICFCIGSFLINRHPLETKIQIKLGLCNLIEVNCCNVILSIYAEGCNNLILLMQFF